MPVFEKCFGSWHRSAVVFCDICFCVNSVTSPICGPIGCHLPCSYVFFWRRGRGQCTSGWTKLLFTRGLLQTCSRTFLKQHDVWINLKNVATNMYEEKYIQPNHVHTAMSHTISWRNFLRLFYAHSSYVQALPAHVKISFRPCSGTLSHPSSYSPMCSSMRNSPVQLGTFLSQHQTSHWYWSKALGLQKGLN